MKCNPWVGVSIGRRGFPMLGTGKRGLSTYIKELFANNEQGFFYDPNDLSTLFQDNMGTVPVTGTGQPVGLIRDKSGNNNHAYQTATASRPILRKNAVTGAYYLEFDGSDDFLQTGGIDFTSTNKLSLFAGVRKLSDAATGVLCELSTNATSINGTFYIRAPNGVNNPNFAFVSRGTATSNNATTDFFAAPISAVLSTKADIASPYSKIRVNGNDKISTSSQGGGNYGNYPLFIGRRGGTATPFNGHVYSLIGVDKLVSDNETVVIEKELAKRVGVTLDV